MVTVETIGRIKRAFEVDHKPIRSTISGQSSAT
jgi:hypothetical protein